MGFGKATQLFGVFLAMVTAGGDTIMLETTHLADMIIKVKRMQDR